MVLHIDDMLSSDTIFGALFVYGKSSRYFALVSNLARKKFYVNNQAILRLSDLNDLLKIGDSLRVVPLYSPYRLVIIEDQKQSVSKEVALLLPKISRFTRFVIGFSNYALFQEFKQGSHFSNYTPESLFGTYLTASEFNYLYEATLKVANASVLSEDLYRVVSKRYLRDVDAVFTILATLKEGVPIKDRATLVQLAGVGSLQVEKIALSLLTSTTKTVKGLKQFKSKQVQQLLELCQQKSFASVQKGLLDSYKAILLLKELIVEGKVFPEIGNIPDMSAYGNYHIGKYTRSLEAIDALSMAQIVNYMSLVSSSRWTSELDIIKFVHSVAEQVVLKNRGNV